MSLPSYLLKLPFRLKDFPEFGRDDLAKLTVAQLKDMLKEKGLKAGHGHGENDHRCPTGSSGSSKDRWRFVTRVEKELRDAGTTVGIFGNHIVKQIQVVGKNYRKIE